MPKGQTSGVSSREAKAADPRETLQLTDGSWGRVLIRSGQKLKKTQSW